MPGQWPPPVQDAVSEILHPGAGLQEPPANLDSVGDHLVWGGGRGGAGVGNSGLHVFRQTDAEGHPCFSTFGA